MAVAGAQAGSEPPVVTVDPAEPVWYHQANEHLYAQHFCEDHRPINGNASVFVHFGPP